MSVSATSIPIPKVTVPTIYIVSDMKTVWDKANNNYAVLTNTTQHRDRFKAESRYHTALASAANSETIERWSAVLMTNAGFVIASESYDHEVPEPEPESEGEGA